jgi:hypothetical protein
MRGPRPFRIFLMGILALTPVAQACWFAWAWRLIGAVAWPGPRSLLQGVWVVAALVVLATGLDLLGVRVIPRQAARPWARAVARIWLIASCLGFLAVTAMGGLEWLSRPAMAVLPAAQAARIEPARRTLFRYATYLAGGLPLLTAAYGATAGRRWYRVVTVEVPISGLPSRLEGLRIVHLSDLHIGDFMPRAAIRRAVDLANTVKPDLAVLTGDLITSERDPLEDCITELSRLQAPRPLQSGGYAACCAGSSPICMPGYHRQNRSRRSPFNTCVRTCRSRWAPRFVHFICCFFTNRLLIT